MGSLESCLSFLLLAPVYSNQLRKLKNTGAHDCMTGLTAGITGHHAGKLGRNFVLALIALPFGMCHASQKKGREAGEKCQLRKLKEL